MELYQLRSFLEIVATQNLTRAAGNLHVSQSALSSQIRLLEEELGVQLFERSARGMHLSERGRLLHSYAEDVVRSAQVLSDKAREMSGRQYGTCRIGLNTDGAFLKVGKLNRALTKNLPDVNFIFVSSQTIRTPEMLRQGMIDIGFFFGDCLDSGIDSHILDTVRIVIAVPESILPAGSRLDWPLAASLPWIWSVCDCPYYQVVRQQMDGFGLTPRKAVDAMDESVVRELLVDGQGLAILRHDEALAAVRQGGLWIWDEVAFSVPLRLGRLRHTGDAGLIAAVAATIDGIWMEGREN